jgi:hypothetical protein
MTDLRAAAKQALEALEDLGMKYYETTGETLHKEAYAALRAALEQPEPMCVGCEGKPTLQNSPCAVCGKIAQQEQGPVAWRYKPMVGSPWSLSDDGYYISCKRDRGYIVEPLHTHPPRCEPEPPPEPIHPDKIRAEFLDIDRHTLPGEMTLEDWFTEGVRFAEKEHFKEQK